MRADSPTEIGTTAQCKIGGRAGQAGKGRFAAQPPAMRPGTEQRRRRDRANAAAGQELRREPLDPAGELALERRADSEDALHRVRGFSAL